ncbi:MAG: 2-C-methyl-D-erythritol 2,4-cyclodiphosphate synthase [Oscillospiraceae bacterium]|nr:2-C-methyl-D-erythritol 2,4-cyclodiphosphate synthase [Oscillospiraceae bacterium]
MPNSTLRIGQGYDVHRLAEGRPLILGGVLIPHGRGLLGHSDADVLTHAVMDALLGAAGKADIGAHFPDSDERFSGADSIKLLAETAGIIAPYSVVNIDTTVIAQAPKLGPYREAMRENIASALGVKPCAVNVKFTTEEELGFTGAGEGIAAQAVCLLRE